MRLLKLLPIALLVLLISSFRDIKSSDAVTGIAQYHFFHIRDTTNIGRIWLEDFTLAFNSK